MRRVWFAAAGSHLSVAFMAAVLCFELAIRTAPLPDLSRAGELSRQVLAVTGLPLWTFLAGDDRWRLATRPEAVDPLYLGMLVAYEDKRFFLHKGIDLLAAGRAAWQTVRHRRIVSGASTLTMQTVRLLEPRPTSFSAKVEQALKALKLERQLSKNEILQLYLTLAPFGGNIEGLRAATLAYFGKEPARLSTGEAALLTAIPQAPEERRPDRGLERAKAARDRVLRVASDRGLIGELDAQRTAEEPIRLRPQTLARFAPHFSSRVAAGSRTFRISTYIEPKIQSLAERLASEAAAGLDDHVNAAIVVLRNRDAAVVAYVGGVDHVSASRAGYVDLARSIRSPGSALKPFIYAMAFEDLLVHPDTIIADRAVEFDGYAPENADGLYAGDVTVRQALIRSLNTTAVTLMNAIGTDQFLGRFRSIGAPLVLPASDSEAGLAVALGGLGISLERLTWFYTAFANAGELKAMRLTPSEPTHSHGALLEPSAALATADILADVLPPPSFARRAALDGGRRIGFKTGTSYGFRDAWAVGFDQDHTVGVWVGRPDGAPHLGTYGISSAAPILLRLFDGIAVPKAGVASGVGALASPRTLPQRLRRYGPSPAEGGTGKLRIRFPADGALIRTDRPRGDAIEISVALEGGHPPYHWFASGQAQPAASGREFRWRVRGRGQMELRVIDRHGHLATSSFWVE